MLGKNLYVSTIVRTIKRGRIEEVKETKTTYEFKVEGKKKLYVLAWKIVLLFYKFLKFIYHLL